VFVLRVCIDIALFFSSLFYLSSLFVSFSLSNYLSICLSISLSLSLSPYYIHTYTHTPHTLTLSHSHTHTHTHSHTHILTYSHTHTHVAINAHTASGGFGVCLVTPLRTLRAMPCTDLSPDLTEKKTFMAVVLVVFCIYSCSRACMHGWDAQDSYFLISSKNITRMRTRGTLCFQISLLAQAPLIYVCNTSKENSDCQ
jgi:hypothetical protein